MLTNYSAISIYRYNRETMALLQESFDSPEPFAHVFLVAVRGGGQGERCGPPPAERIG
ncbi:MAG TPA: hypothetical protein PLR10_07125 [Smithella sp.]|nr:hypothetical protein [Smithella sp.]HOU50966.1 hypothetical protein [Smithella sp.]HQG65149.1 hypothetical protein [Smithella sp.]HQH16328.1 hypothetical protein [Smithella sp.]HQI72426.1 hypothetical protein [Smithella sp.]